MGSSILKLNRWFCQLWYTSKCVMTKSSMEIIWRQKRLLEGGWRYGMTPPPYCFHNLPLRHRTRSIAPRAGLPNSRARFLQISACRHQRQHSSFIPSARTKCGARDQLKCTMIFQLGFNYTGIENGQGINFENRPEESDSLEKLTQYRTLGEVGTKVGT